MCVLLVEDDPLIARTVSETLREDGYELVAAADGETGIARFDDAPGRFSLLLTDVQLSGPIQGTDVASHVRARRPEIPVIIASGRPDILEERWRTENGYVVLVKPYRLRQLVDVIRSLTGAGRAAEGDR